MERGQGVRKIVSEGFILDFYCVETKVAIELDGPITS
jgi:very-short-patch-repair endonuclease